MATLTIQDLDEALEQRLRTRAAQAHRSMEEEASQILRSALAPSAQETSRPETGIAQRVRTRFAGLGDVNLPVIKREPLRNLWVPIG